MPSNNHFDRLNGCVGNLHVPIRISLIGVVFFSDEIKRQLDIVIAFIDENKFRSVKKIDSNLLNSLEEKNELNGTF